MIKLVAFDWNGTIFADTFAILDGVNAVLKLLGLKEVTLRQFQQHFDVPVTRTYLGLGIPQDVINKRADEIVETFHSYYELRAVKARTRAYAKELLNWLAENHISSVIFSNHIEKSINAHLKRLKLDKFISYVIATSDKSTSLHGRTKKEKLKAFMKEHKFLPKETLIIGDTIEEIEIGKELEVESVAITDGNCSTKRLKAAKSVYLISSLKDIIGIIEKINQPVV